MMVGWIDVEEDVVRYRNSVLTPGVAFAVRCPASLERQSCHREAHFEYPFDMWVMLSELITLL